MSTKKSKLNWNSIPMRIASVSILTLLMMLPMQQISQLIYERKHNQESVSYEMHRTWGGEQMVGGPYLVVPYTYTQKVKRLNTPVYSAVFIPNNLKIESDILPKEKYRGIYKYIVYQSQIHFKGTFDPIDISLLQDEKIDLEKATFQWDKATLRCSISDLNGLNNQVKVNWNEDVYEVQALAPHTAQGNNVQQSLEGFSARVSINPEQSNAFSFDLDLKGSSSLEFLPLAKFTEVSAKSSWASPMFVGNYSPDHQTNDSGFTAKWNISNLNRPTKQAWLGSSIPSPDKYAFGVSLIEPVDKYLKSLRAAKYALLFIVLTFVGLFFVELFTKKENGLIQYLLTGFALVLFYSLLLSLTEHMEFNLAYVISSSAIIILISAYAHSMTKNFKSSMILFLLWSVLYAYLFFILQLEDFALLVGNIGLFVILAIIMFTSRKLKFSNSSDTPVENQMDKGDLL